MRESPFFFAGVTISSGSVPVADLLFSTNNKLAGRATAGAGAGEEIGVAGALAFSGFNVIVANNGISNALLRQSPAVSLVGNPTGGVANVTDITLGAGLSFVGTTLTSTITQYTDEQAQDATGAMAANSARVTLTYVDATPSLTADLVLDTVTVGYMHSSATDRLFGRDTAAAGAGEEISVSGGLEFTGTAGIQRSALTGDVTAAAGSNATTIAAGAVTYAKSADSVGLSVAGRSANTTGVRADIVAANDGEVLRRSGTALGFGTLAAGAFANNTIALGRLANATQRARIAAAAAGAFAEVAESANFTTFAASADFAAMRTNLSLVVGTNVQAWDADLDALAALAGTNTIYYRSAANTWSAVTYGAGLALTAGVLDLVNNAVTLAKLSNASARSMIAASGAGAWTETALSANVFTMLGSADNAAVRSNISAAGLGSNTFTSEQTISVSSGNLLLVQLNDDGAARGPSVTTFRNSATPAAADNIGCWVNTGKNSAGTTYEYSSIECRITDPTAGTESAQIRLRNSSSGVGSAKFILDQGVFHIFTADMGAGTLNFPTYYANSILIASSNGTLNTASFTVATLPAAASFPGARTYVTDSLLAAPTFMVAVVAGGTGKVPVFSDGTIWRYG